MRGEPAARCEGCGFAWYGATSADGLRALGHCIRCGGKIVFGERAAKAERIEHIDPAMGPHQVLGAPKLPF